MLLLFLRQLPRNPASTEKLPPTKDKVRNPGGGFCAERFRRSCEGSEERLTEAQTSPLLSPSFCLTSSVSDKRDGERSAEGFLLVVLTRLLSSDVSVSPNTNKMQVNENLIRSGCFSNCNGFYRHDTNYYPYTGSPKGKHTHTHTHMCVHRRLRCCFISNSCLQSPG